MAETKIAGVEYKVSPLTAPEALAFISEIIVMAGPGLRHLPLILKGVVEDEEDSESGGGFVADIAAAAACSAMIKEFGIEAFVDFKRRIIETATVKRPSGVYEQVMAESDFIGKLVECELLYDYIIGEQFGPFSKGSEASGPLGLSLTLVRNIFQVKK